MKIKWDWLLNEIAYIFHNSGLLDFATDDNRVSIAPQSRTSLGMSSGVIVGLIAENNSTLLSSPVRCVFGTIGNFLTVCNGEAASGDTKAVTEFPATLKIIIERGNYPPELIFNVDETGQNWKRKPIRTFLTREEKRAPGFKAAKDRLTLLLGGNASGDFKLKPLLVYHSKNPRATKGISELTLPVIWESNKKSWITMNIFQN
ncbi:tigger transposable element-derived protein 1 [Trichonephila clavipes]|uniref:Tigger transposable element-derived protein 1 n=1 Tax=Trichonephila clavipes TaxID=2585209 RepID=A0A8X6VH14_TRICX|nr:tigger transposable element-derived protein 1 [Trichonephila clavipes]